MKRLILAEILLLFLATTFQSDSTGGWVQQTLPVNKTINDIFFMDSLTGWVVTALASSTDTGYVLRTTNGGNAWTIQYSARPINFNAVQFMNANTGYAGANTSGGTGKIYKTTDGGSNWTNIASMGTMFTDVFFVNSNTGWVCDNDGTFGTGIIKTIDGGSTWQQQAPASYRPQRLFFINKDTGWAISNETNTRLFHTNNGGINWNLEFTFSNGGAGDVFFSSKDTGWATGGTTGILKTVNSGNSWFTQNSPISVGGGAKIFFINNTRGYISANSFSMDVTFDGSNWGYQTTPAASNFSVFFTDTSRGWAGTSILIHTTDGGGPLTYIGIRPNSTIVPAFELRQNYPNSFNPSTSIDFDVKKNSRISLRVFSVDGREVDELLNYEKFTTGSYYVKYEVSNRLASGVYFYQMTGWTDDGKEIFIDTKKMILLK